MRCNMRLLSIERRWTRAVLDAMFPANASESLSLGILDLDVDAYLDETLEKLPRVSAIGLRAGFAAIAFSPPVTIAKLCTIDRLQLEDRQRVLEKLYNAPIYHVRQLVVLAKTTGAMLYCAAPAARAVMMGSASTARGGKRVAQDEHASLIGEVANVPA